MKLTIETSSYNEKRYGKPWIANVDFENNKQGYFRFGEWVGSLGGSGLLEIEATPGDIIARGQKDMRKPRNSAPDFYQLQADGTLEDISKVEAYKRWKNAQDQEPVNPMANFTDDEILAEAKIRGLI